ncbi:MAG: cytochrome b N-terminal domain-containing protein [Candidatus Levyibacteriota bacterium]
MEDSPKGIGTIQLLKSVMLENVPSYANKFFYSLGFLSMICFMLLIITGSVMVFFGPDWWFKTPVGIFTRSVHLWSLQAFVVFMILHLFIVFLTSGFKPPRRFLWVLGSIMFFLVLTEAEFGYVLRDDFSSQWRSLQGADLYNGSGLGLFINNLNYAQIYGIHIVIIPLLLLGVLFLHYGLIRLRGIAKPYRKDVPVRMVKANHTVLFLRGAVLMIVIIILAIIFPSPIISPLTIKQIANEDPGLMAKTLISEIDHSSDTATYSDDIDPYQFDTKKVYVEEPYAQYVELKGGTDSLALFNNAQKEKQEKMLKDASDYFEKEGVITVKDNPKNPVIPVISALVLMGKNGLYEAAIRNESDTGYNTTYPLRFLSDTGALEDQATKLTMTTDQYGMLREEKVTIPPGAWWLAPLGLLDHSVLANDDNQDRDGAIILGSLVLLLMAFPYIPFLNRLPELFHVDRLLWKDRKAVS